MYEQYGKKSIISIVLMACLIMGLIDAVIQPGYVIKSGAKVVLFLALPYIYTKMNKECQLKQVLKPTKEGFFRAVLMGIGVYVVIIASYFIAKNYFDFSGVTSTLTTSGGVSAQNFIWVALYISFINSLLEEFFFRGFAFFSLKEVSNRKFAYLFSSITFALYHIAMMIGWFDFVVILLALTGLVIGGMLFNFLNEKSGNIYISWIVHMCANFAINTVGLMLFGIL